MWHALTNSTRNRKRVSKAARHFTLAPEPLEDRRLLTIVPADLGLGDMYYLAFTTAQRTYGFFPGYGTGVAGADAFVDAQACTATLNDTSCTIDYRAIISDGTQNANNGLGLAAGVPIYNSAGLRVADDFTDLWQTASTPLQNPLDSDENGQLIDPSHPEVWTGTTAVGVNSGSNGGNWTGTDVATHGVAGAVGPQWIEDNPVRFHTDGAQLCVYGISEKLTVPDQTGSIHGQKWWDVDGDGIRDMDQFIVPGGVDDNFSTANGPELTNPEPWLIGINPNPRADYDATSNNRYFVESLRFNAPALPIADAFLRIRMKPLSSNASNDALNLFSSAWPTTVRDAYSIGNDLAGNTWNPTNFPNGITRNIPISCEVLDLVRANNRLDIYIQDDTSVDFVELHVKTMEPGLNGWTMQVTDPQTGQVVATQVTHDHDVDGDGCINPVTESGFYWIENLPPGTYHVGEIVQPGWMQTSPSPTVEVNGLAVADNWYQAFAGNATGSSLSTIGPIVAGPTPSGRSIVNGTATPPTTGFVTSEDYLYFSTWSDDQIAQGFLADVTLNSNHVLGGDPAWRVFNTQSDYDTPAGPPAATVAGDISSATWQLPAIGPANSGTGLFGTVGPVSGISASANWMWYDTGNQGGSTAPFVGGFNHDEYLIMRLPTGAGKHTVVVGPGQVVEGIDFGNKGTGSIHGQKWWDVDGDGIRDMDQVVVPGGVNDQFSTANGPELTNPEPGLIGINPNPRADYDGTANNHYFVESLRFNAPALPIADAFLRIHMKPLSSDAWNDGLNLFSSSWPASVRDTYSIGSLAGNTWNPTNFPSGITLDIPISCDVLNDVRTNNRLDIYIQDDTSVDFVELHVKTMEPGLNGWTMQVTDPQTGQVIATQVTHDHDVDGDGCINPVTESGFYWIENLPPGTYHVGEIVQPGWMQTSPSPIVEVNGLAVADNWYQAFAGNATGTSLSTIGPIVAGPTSSGRSIVNGTATPPTTGFNTSEDYLYFSTWSDDLIAQGFLADVTLDGNHVLGGDPAWRVYNTQSDYDTSAGPPAATVAGDISSATWQLPAIGPANSGTGLYGAVGPVSGISASANWMWYDTGNQGGSTAPFVGGFNHDEYLIMRLPTGAGKHTVVVGPGQVVEDIDFGNKGTGSIHGQKFQKVNRQYRDIKGDTDNFALPTEPTTPSAALQNYLTVAGRLTKPYDDPTIDRFVAESFESLPDCIIGGFLYMRVRPGNSSLSRNDTIGLGVIDPAYTSGNPWLAAQGHHIGAGYSNSLLPQRWNTANYGAKTLKIPLTASVIAAMNAHNRLDVMVQDDTTVDWMRLDLKYQKRVGLNNWTINVTPVGGGPVISQTTMDMDLNGDGVIDPMTERGLYWIENLPPDVYSVSEVIITPWLVPVDPNVGLQNVVVGPGESVQNVDFQNGSRGIIWNPVDIGDILNPGPVVGVGDLGDFIGVPSGVIDFEGLSGVIPPDQYAASDGVTFANLAGLGANPEGGMTVETLDGFDGTYQPDGNTVYVSWPNNVDPFTIMFDTPVSSVGSFIGTGKEGTIDTLTVEAFDVNGDLILSNQVTVQPNADPDNREGFWGIRAPEDAIAKITILNDNPDDFGNALIIDDIRWGRGADYAGQFAAAAAGFDDFFAGQPGTVESIGFETAPDDIPGDFYVADYGVTLQASNQNQDPVTLLKRREGSDDVGVIDGYNGSYRPDGDEVMVVPADVPAYDTCGLVPDDDMCNQLDPNDPLPGLTVTFDPPVNSVGATVLAAIGDDDAASGVGRETCDRARVFAPDGTLLGEVVFDVSLYGDADNAEGFFTFDGQGALIGSIVIEPLDPASAADGGTRFDPTTTLSIDNLTFTRSATVDCDFDGDGDCDIDDIDSLVANIASGSNDPLYDLNGDGQVDLADLNDWLIAAGELNLGPGRAYLPGDSNLDGVVDGSDFGAWNSNKFTSTAAWSAGDFNADGFVDGSDFGIWNGNKFRSSDASSGFVPRRTSEVQHEKGADRDELRARLLDRIFAASEMAFL